MDTKFLGHIAGRATMKLAAVLLLSLQIGTAQADGRVLQLDLEGPLGVATSEYIVAGIELANEQGARLVLIRMDTPGGLVEPMRDIVRAILGSDVPVVTYVSPGGARADSAGTYILLASHVAAMAPTTHLGAATPVSLGGDDAKSPLAPRSPLPESAPRDSGNDSEDNGPGAPEDGQTADEKPAEDAREPDTAMGRKVLNDAIAYIRGLAETHGRNADWAEQAVRDASTLTATEALEQNVIDLIAVDREALLEQLNGRELKANNKTVTLDTENVTVERVEPGWRIRFLSTIAN
ncbi:MAG: hypothetical protein KDI09_22645, partial [Halioglobus sp.]|nr:hypothetical protein [Halioglobus sp.]